MADGADILAISNRVRARPRASVTQIAPYVPGRSIDEVRRLFGLSEVIKLASNESPFGPSPRAVEAAAAAVMNSGRYPDAGAVRMRERIAEYTGTTPEHIVVGNGSDELILLLALAYLESGLEAVLPAPPYSIHRTAVLTAGGTQVGVPLQDHVHDLEGMVSAVTERTRLLFVTNPHNPTGTVIDRAALERMAESLPPHTLLVVDEAYHEFADDGQRFAAYDLLERYPHVITLRTFSKAYGLPGLRIGYAVAHPEIVTELQRIRPPFNLNVAAQAAAVAALDDPEHLQDVVERSRHGRERLEEIARQRDLPYIPSQANFVLMFVGDSQGVAHRFLQQGMIVRPGDNLGVPGWLRVSVGTDEEIDRFEAILDEVLAEL